LQLGGDGGDGIVGGAAMLFEIGGAVADGGDGETRWWMSGDRGGNFYEGRGVLRVELCDSSIQLKARTNDGRCRTEAG
jgi:hypothetical protein